MALLLEITGVVNTKGFAWSTWPETEAGGSKQVTAVRVNAHRIRAVIDLGQLRLVELGSDATIDTKMTMEELADAFRQATRFNEGQKIWPKKPKPLSPDAPKPKPPAPVKPPVVADQRPPRGRRPAPAIRTAPSGAKIGPSGKIWP